MTREEAINEVKKAMPTLWKETKDAIQTIIPEFAESDDERMKREIAILKQQRDFWSYDGPARKFPPATPRKDLVEALDIAIAWLNKCKESLHVSETCKENANFFTDEDERIRKHLIARLKPLAENDGIFDYLITKDKVLAYLEKQKDIHFDYPGLYFYDGEKLHFQGNPAMEENPYDFAISQQEKQKEQKPILKFKVGDKIHLIDGTSPNYEDDCITIREIGTVNYIGEFKEGYVPIKEQNKWELAKEQKPIFRVGDNIIAKDGTCIPKEPFHIERIEDGCYWEGNGSILICNQDDFQLIDQKPADNVSKEEYVKRFKALCEAYEIKLPNREYDIYHLCDDLSKLSTDSDKQNPAEYLSKRKVYDIMNKLTELSTSALIPVKSEEYVKIHEITSDVRSLLDYPIEQKSAEWSEADESFLDSIEDAISSYYDLNHAPQYHYWLEEKLKSIRSVKQEWSKEDEIRSKCCILYLANARDCIEFNQHIGDNVRELGKKEIQKDINWLKSLPERFNLQPKQEWSEEDEKNCNRIIRFLEPHKTFFPTKETKEEMQNWIKNRLKSLRPQPKAELTLLDKNIINAAVAFVKQNDHFNCWGGIDKHAVIKALRSLKPSWKPSKEQIEALECAERWYSDNMGGNTALYQLLCDLKSYNL